MKFIRFGKGGRSRKGYLEPGRAVDLAATAEDKGASPALLEAIRTAPLETLVVDPNHIAEIRSLGEATRAESGRRPYYYAEDEIEFLPPVSRPGKIVCAGLNYPPPETAAAEAGPEYPVLFHKAASALTGHRTPILHPRISRAVEYEGELAIVIGKPAKNIHEDQAPGCIAGFSIANDLGASDIQGRSSQWASGKMFDTFCPLGPALVTPDEVPDPADLRIRTRLNEELVQDCSTSRMIFKPFFLVSYISGLTQLQPGDMILTGSPRTVGDRPDPRRLLAPGDMIEVEIERLGTLSNPVHMEA